MTAWSSIGYYECLTRQDIEDNINNGTFSRKIFFTVDNKLVTKDEVSAYINFTANSTFTAKSGNQIIIKGDINVAGSPTPTPPPPTATPTLNNRYYVRKLNADCSLTSTYLYASLGAGITPPTVNQYVTLSEVTGCYVVVSIDQSNSVTSTINGVFATSCTCTDPLISQTYSYSTFSACVGVPSAYQTMTVSGVYLTNDIIITQGNEMQFSLNPTTNYVSSLTLTPSSGIVSPTTIYVRLNGNYFYSPSGLTIQVSSIGASTRTQTVSTAYVVPSPTITSTTPGSRIGTGTVTLSATVSSNCTADWYAASTGGTALAIGTLNFTTPSITTTTTYYVEARDTSGNNCGVTSYRTAVVATVVPPPDPAPINGTLKTSIIFWGGLSQVNGGTYGSQVYTEKSSHSINAANVFYYIGSYPTQDYITFTGGSGNYLRFRPDLENTPNNGYYYTLMFYGNLPPVNGSNIYHLWSRESNTYGWDTIWEPTTNRFTFRTQGNSDQYINYTRTSSDSNMRLWTFTYSQYDSTTTKIELYVDGTKINEFLGYNNHMLFDKAATYLRFGLGPSGDAVGYVGNVSNVLMYNTTLTQTQISSIYQYLSGNVPTSTTTTFYALY